MTTVSATWAPQVWRHEKRLSPAAQVMTVAAAHRSGGATIVHRVLDALPHGRVPVVFVVHQRGRPEAVDALPAVADAVSAAREHPRPLRERRARCGRERVPRVRACEPHPAGAGPRRDAIRAERLAPLCGEPGATSAFSLCIGRFRQRALTRRRGHNVRAVGHVGHARGRRIPSPSTTIGATVATST